MASAIAPPCNPQIRTSSATSHRPPSTSQPWRRHQIPFSGLACQTKLCSQASNGKSHSFAPPHIIGSHASRAARIAVKAEGGIDSLIADGAYGDSFSCRCRDAVVRTSRSLFIEGLAAEIAALALPAVLAQAIEPLAQLLETAYVGRLGVVELAAVGVSVSIFNLVSKIFNVPLLNMTTSFVAADDVAGTICSANEQTSEQQATPQKRIIPAVSSALLLASLLAALETSILALGVGPILSLMGVHLNSAMRYPAAKYLVIRALGAPANVLSLAIQGIFRGFKDTKTPLYATVVGSIYNILVAPILMFSFGFGLTGSAVATVSSQYLVALTLLWNLKKKVILVPPKLSVLRLNQFLRSGGFLLGRTIALLFTMTLATSMAARQGPVAMAAQQILMQIWLATSLLSDALALAGQALMATALAKGDLVKVREIAFGVLQMGLSFGMILAMTVAVSLGTVVKSFTKDSVVLAILAKGTLFVAGTQPLNALAFVFDGIIYGVGDFEFAAYSMMVVGLLSSLCLLAAPSYLGLSGVWLGLTILMSLRVTAGIVRLKSATGPWRFLKHITAESYLQ